MAWIGPAADLTSTKHPGTDQAQAMATSCLVPPPRQDLGATSPEIFAAQSRRYPEVESRSAPFFGLPRAEASGWSRGQTSLVEHSVKAAKAAAKRSSLMWMRFRRLVM
mmetsp:Transcript_104435/g.261816  ORF Transcript_104435/g.261816 Transcript_104435/m.261816 type:complete len:108 (+) Transcript_104435:146-469(+)